MKQSKQFSPVSEVHQIFFLNPKQWKFTKKSQNEKTFIKGAYLISELHGLRISCSQGTQKFWWW